MFVFIAGKGVVTSIGKNASENLASLRAQQAGISKLSLLTSRYADTLPVGEVKITNQELAALAGLNPTFSRTALLSCIAAEEAIANAAIPDLKKWRMGFLSANTVGGMDQTEDGAQANGAEVAASEVAHHPMPSSRRKD